MNRHVTIIAAVFLKDLRQLWPLAALAAATILAQWFLNYNDSPGVVNLLHNVASLISGIFLIGLVQRDAPASLRHEWLTRPISGLDLLAAKFLLAATALLLPAILGAGPIIAAARDGAPMSEALLVAIADTQTFWFICFGLVVVAAVTLNLLQAAGVVVGLVLLFILLQPPLGPSLGLFGGASVSGSGWLVAAGLGLIGFAGGMAVLWLVYAARRPVAARIALGATVALLVVTMALPSRDAVLAIQKYVTGGNPAADGFDFALAPICFEEKSTSPSGDAERPLTEAQLRERAVTFTTATRARGLPAGWRMMIGDVQASFLDASGAVLERLKPAGNIAERPVVPGADSETRYPWIMEQARFDAIARRATGLRFDYGVGLLAPTHVAEIASDGVRHDIPGLGVCTATPRSERLVQVSCFVAGRQPGMLTARMGNDAEIASGELSFAPALLRFSPGKSQGMLLRRATPSAQPRVTLTAYEAQAYVTRSVSTPVAPGGVTSSCRPISSGEDDNRAGSEK